MIPESDVTCLLPHLIYAQLPLLRALGGAYYPIVLVLVRMAAPLAAR